MRITVKHQVLLAPAIMLCLLLLLLGFMQFTYWNLAAKRQEARAIGTNFVALAEADMAARRLHVLIRSFQYSGMASPEEMALVADLYERLASAVERLEPFGPLKQSGQIDLLQQLAAQLNPADSTTPEETAKNYAIFRAELSGLSNLTQIHLNRLRATQEQDFAKLVERTYVISMVILVLAIGLGTCISIYFGRRILKRIQVLSQNALQIADGNLALPPAPDHIKDELDTLAVSISRMTKRLIRVVGTEKLFEGAEEERRRIAMDLHDQSLSDLSGILRGLQAVGGEITEPAPRDKVSELEQDLAQAITNLRDIMNNLHPQTLDILGLGAAIETHLEQHCETDGLPEFHFYQDGRVGRLTFDKMQQLFLYRIAIEAIQNVIKHAMATRYEVSLELRDDILVLAVEDNGHGMDMTTTRQFEGHGLHNIQERAKKIGANVKWGRSRFSSGTRFELTLACGDIV